MFVFYPTLNTVYLSFFSFEGRTIGDFAGLSNYLEVFGRRGFLNVDRLLQGPPMGALVHNGLWIAIHLPLSLVLGLLLAVLLRDVRGGFVVKSIIFLGMVIPMIVGGMLLRFIYDSDAGIVNGALRMIGLGDMAKTFTAFPDTSLISLILGTVWIWTGFSMIVYSAGLEGIPAELYEAARIDGASRVRMFWHITIPMLRPAHVVVVTMTLLWIMKIFDIVYAATFGGPGGSTSVLAFLVYIDAFFKLPPDFGTASAIATLLTLMIFGFAAYMVRSMVKQ
ncbi:MAG: carbohydrate ABC transporter permease [Thermoplasmata archaeon]